MESVRAIINALSSEEVRYLVVGGLAVVAHGYVRYTVAMDLVVALEPDNVRRCMLALTGLGYQPRVPVSAEAFADAQTREEWIRDRGMVVFQLTSDHHPEPPVDIFVTEPFDFDEEYGRAAWRHLPGGLKVPVVSLEELLAMKIATDRPKDRLDVEKLRDLLGPS